MYLLQKPPDISLVLEWELVAEEDAQQALQGVLDVHLDEAELLIALVLQDLAEETDVVIVILMHLDAVDDGDKPFYDKVLEAVLLIQISVDVLLHGFAALLRVLALFVKLDLLRVDVLNRVSKLLDGQVSHLDRPKLTRHGESRVRRLAERHARSVR